MTNELSETYKGAVPQHPRDSGAKDKPTKVEDQVTPMKCCQESLSR